MSTKTRQASANSCVTGEMGDGICFVGVVETGLLAWPCMPST